MKRIDFDLIKAGGRKGEAEMKRLLDNHEGYIVQFAKSYLGRVKNDGRAITFYDLRATAMLGMIASVQKYNPEKGNFISWATNYMKSSIHELCGQTHSQSYYEEDSLDYDCADAEGKEAYEDSDISDGMDTSIDYETDSEEVEIRHSRHTVNAAYEGGELVPMSDSSAEDSVSYKEVMAKVRSVLNDEEYKIFCRYRGLAGYTAETMPVIAKDMGISLLHAQCAYLHSLVELGIDVD